MAANDYFRFENSVQVRTNQELHGPPSLFFADDMSYAGFNFGDTYGVWGLSTSAKDDRYDPEFNNPYIVLEWSQIKITHRAGAGNLVHWVIAIQD